MLAEASRGLVNPQWVTRRRQGRPEVGLGAHPAVSRRPGRPSPPAGSKARPRRRFSPSVARLQSRTGPVARRPSGWCVAVLVTPPPQARPDQFASVADGNGQAERRSFPVWFSSRLVVSLRLENHISWEVIVFFGNIRAGTVSLGRPESRQVFEAVLPEPIRSHTAEFGG